VRRKRRREIARLCEQRETGKDVGDHDGEGDATALVARGRVGVTLRQESGGEATACAEAGNEHRNALLIFDVVVAVEGAEIAFLELDGDQDVGGRHHREDEMSDRHVWCAPEGEKPADVERVSHEAVKAGRGETQRTVVDAAEVFPDLAEAEEIEVVDEKRGHQHEQPTEAETGVEGGAAERVIDMPDDSAHRLPEREKRDEQNRGGEDVGAAFGGDGHPACPPVFERGAGHDAVLQRERGEEAEVDQECATERRGGRGVQRGGNEKTADKSDGVEEGGEKDRVAQKTIREHAEAAGHWRQDR